jgi:hypothetical protein
MPSSTEFLLKLFLPDFLLENFEFKGVIESEDTFHIELEELNILPRHICRLSLCQALTFQA